MFGFFEKKEEKQFDSRIRKDFICRCGNDRFSMVFKAEVSTLRGEKFDDKRWSSLYIPMNGQYPDLECIKCRTLYDTQGQILFAKIKKEGE